MGAEGDEGNGERSQGLTGGAVVALLAAEPKGAATNVEHVRRGNAATAQPASPAFISVPNIVVSIKNHAAGKRGTKMMATTSLPRNARKRETFYGYQDNLNGTTAVSG